MLDRSNAIAVVGMACRFPQGLESLEQLWSALRNRTSAITEVPSDRWAADRYFSSNDIAKGKAYMRRGGFLRHDVTTFDAAFFGISPRDAENMDPQQRLMLEVVWEAFENGGLVLPNYAGKRVGVYVGGFMLDHMITQMTPSNRSQINQHTAAGMMMTMLSNRISHAFDLRGPSLSIDTACSSSLVAFHYACQDLWRGACELAVVGGANVMMRPEYPMGMCKGHFLSRDGECKSFDARADGYGRGEGAGAIVLKPLSLAQRDHDPILAIVIGTGSNQDGRTPGISMPNGQAQRALIAEVCDTYSIDPHAIRYVECHGTGTAIGDPTEARAIGEIYGANRGPEDRVMIGSIKSNIGHLEAAAGVAGVIKAVLTLMHRQATPLANLQQPNPQIPFDELGLRLSDDLLPLGNSQETICAAVNSFGYGGSNAHIVLQTAPTVAATNGKSSHEPVIPVRVPDEYPLFLPLSARSEAALRARAIQFAEVLRSGVSCQDFLHTVSLRRAHLAQRAVVSGRTREELIVLLEALSRGEHHPSIATGAEPYQGSRLPVFVYTGMGPQWWGMGQELYHDSSVYRTTVQAADQIFQRIAGFSILAEMLREESASRITRTEFAQPANLMIQIGITEMLTRAGIVPGAIVGHSVGELGAAYAAGVLGLQDIITVCYHRSRLQATTAGSGAMLAVGLSKSDALDRIADVRDKVSIAAVNGPTTVTMAGQSECLEQIAQRLTQEGIFNRKLDVEVPYHSPLMDPLMRPLAEALSSIAPTTPRIPLYSTVTGQRVDTVSYGAEYWPQNIRQPVEFAAAIDNLLTDGFNTFVEIGPHPVLSTALKDCIRVAGKECRTIHTLRRNQPEWENIQASVMQVYVSGCTIDWSVHHGQGQLIPLPTYPWQRERHWLENDRAQQDRINPIVHPLLGTQETPGSPVWRNDFDHEPVAYLRDHVVAGNPILPAAAYVECLLELAGIHYPSAAGWALRDLQIVAPMLISPDRGLDFVTTYDPREHSAVIRGLENGRLGTGQVHITSYISPLIAPAVDHRVLTELQQSIPHGQNVPEFYQRLAQIGLQYGPTFQTIRELYLNDTGDDVLARITADSRVEENLPQYRMHPTLLDACFQTLTGMLGESESTYLPTHFGEIHLYVDQLPGHIWCHGRKVAHTDRFIDCHLTLMDERGQVIGAVRHLRATAIQRRDRTDQYGDKVKLQILAYEWLYGEALAEPKRLGHWLVVGSPDATTLAMEQRMEDYGAIITARLGFDSHVSPVAHGHVIPVGSVQAASEALDQWGELDGVVILSALNHKDDPLDPTGLAALEEIVPLTQALANRKFGNPPRVYVVTQSAFCVGESDAPVRPNQAAVNGFVRVAFNELDGLRYTSIDLPAHVDEASLEGLVLELLCDAPEDEVAIRYGTRYFSELSDTTLLSQDRLQYELLTDDSPVQVRPLRPDQESVGTARILASPQATVDAGNGLIRVEASLLPPSLLQDATETFAEQAAVEFVGTIVTSGMHASDLTPNMRVCGFAPPNVTSHISVPRSQLHVVEISHDIDANKLVSTIGMAVRAEYAVDSLELDPGARALVQANKLGIRIANRLQHRGVHVVLLGDRNVSHDIPLDAHTPIYDDNATQLMRAVDHETQGQGFQVLVTDSQTWLESFDFRVVAEGGIVVDTNESSHEIYMPAHVGGIVRTQLSGLLAKPKKLTAILRRVVDQIARGDLEPATALSVSVADLAWNKLPLQDTSSSIIVSFDTRGQDLPVVQRETLLLSSAATYLITGGFGGFGFKTALWLAKQGARHLVLTGRTGADSPQRQAMVTELEQLGVEVTAAACDTSNFQQLEQLFQRLSAHERPLKGIFHSAAIIQDQPIQDIDLPTLTKVMQSKALGAWNLHVLSRNLPLDHFVMYSSVANLVGNSRQAAYCAANGFLNGLAHLRQSLGLPATSVNWGAISDVGVVAQDEKLEQFLRYVGLRGIGSAEALLLLEKGLARRVTQFGVTLITSWADWARFETRGGKSPRFARLIQADSGGKESASRDALMAELATLNPLEQVDLVAGLIVEVVASVLKSDPQSLSLDRPINEFGVDSLMATEIQLVLDNSLGLTVSVLELIGNSTIRAIANSAIKSLQGPGHEATTPDTRVALATAD